MKAGLKRRSLLALAAAGTSLATRGIAQAESGQPVLLGEVNIANRETVLSSGSTDLSTLRISTGSRVGLLATNGDAIDFGEVEAAVVAVSSKGNAVIAGALQANGKALEVRGRVAFSSAGFFEIPTGAASWTVYDVPIPEDAIILAQMQQYGGPGVGLRYCVRISPTTFRVQLSAVTRNPTRFGYFVIEPAAALPAENENREG